MEKELLIQAKGYEFFQEDPSTMGYYVYAEYVNKIFDYTHDAENITRNKLSPDRLYIYGHNYETQVADSDMVAPGNDVRFDTLPVRPADFVPGEALEESDGTQRVFVWVAPSGGSAAETTGE